MSERVLMWKDILFNDYMQGIIGQDPLGQRSYQQLLDIILPNSILPCYRNIISYMIQDQSNPNQDQRMISNTIPSFQQTFTQLNLLSPQSFDSKQLTQKIGLYSQQYVSGPDRQNLHSLFKQHNTLHILVQILYETNSSHIFQSIMKALNIIAYNLQTDFQVSYLLAHPSTHKLIDIGTTQIERLDAVESYIQFLKSLSFKLKQEYLPLFFNVQRPLFPLLWVMLLFYNQGRHNSRTTAKLSILEITKLNLPSVNLYLNNFPSLLFFSLFSRHLLTSIKNCVEKQNKEAMFEIADEVSFIDQLSSNVLPSTKNCILNSLIYYPIRHVWNSFQNNTVSLKDTLQIVLLFLLNTDSDPAFTQFLATIVFSKRISKEVLDLMLGEHKQLLSYSEKGYNPQLQSFKQLIQKHSQSVFFPQQIPVPPQPHKRQTILYKTIKSSRDMISNIFKIEDTQSDLKSQIKTVSEVMGTTLKLNSLVNNDYSNNIYVLGQAKGKMMENNPFYSCLMERLKSSPSWVGIYLSVIHRILSNEQLSVVHQEVSHEFVENLPTVLNLIKQNKTVFSMGLALQTLSVSLSKLDPFTLQSLLDFIKPQLNQISTTSFNTLLQSDFTDWENYLEIFSTQQTFLTSATDNPHSQHTFSLEQEQELVICQNQLIIHYASTIRNTIRLLTKEKYKSYKQILRQFHQQNMKRDSTQSQSIQAFGVIVNNKLCWSKIQHNMLRFFEEEGGQVVAEQSLKKFSGCEKSKREMGNRVEYYVSPSPLRLEFQGEQKKRGWMEVVERMGREVGKDEIRLVMRVVEDTPRI